MKKVTSVMTLFVMFFMVSFLASCGYEIIKKDANTVDDKKTTTSCKDDKYNTNYDKYKNASYFSSTIQIESPNVIAKANEIRDKILSITSVEIDSFYANRDRAEIRIYIPEKKAAAVQKMISTLPNIVNINERTSNIGSNYVSYAKQYTFYKVLNDNFDSVEALMMDETCGKADLLEMKKIIQNNLQNFENNLKNYKKQINNAYYQITINKK